MSSEPHYVTKPNIVKGKPSQHLLRTETLMAVGLGVGLFFASIYMIWHFASLTSFDVIIGQFQYLTPLYIGLGLSFAILSVALASLEDAVEAPLVTTSTRINRYLSAFVTNSVTNITDMGALSGANIKSRLFGAWSLNSIDIARHETLIQRSVLITALGLLAAGLLLNKTELNGSYGVSSLTFYVLLAITTCLFLALVIVWARADEPASISSRAKIFSLAVNSLKWLTAAATFYACLHGGANQPFSMIMVVFILAHGLGRLSGLPGGIGVFEAACFVLLNSVAPQVLIVAIIAYRALYFFAPLCVSAVIIGASKFWKNRSGVQSTSAKIFDVFESVTPALFSILTLIIGAAMLISAATPDSGALILGLGDRIGLLVTEVSHLLASLIGCLLLIIAVGLRRRLQNAWGLTLLLLVFGAIFSFVKGGDPAGAFVMLIMAASLFASKDAFYRKGHIRNIPLNWPRLGLIVSTIGFALWIGFYSYIDQPYRHAMWWNFGSDGHVSRFLRAFVLVGIVLGLYGFWRMLQPAPKIQKLATDNPDLAAIRAVLDNAELPGSESNLALMGDKQFLFSESGKSFIMYGVKGRNWVAMGNPVGLQSERKELIWAFRHLADQWDGWPCFYAVRGEDLHDFFDAGLALQKIGELAMISLTDFTMEGKKRGELRNSKSRALREGCTFEIIYPAAQSPEMEQLEAVSRHWLDAHQGKEKRFSMGRFDQSVLNGQPVATIKREGHIIAFANLWTTADKSEISVDLMRYEDVRINGLMDFLFVEIMLWSKAQGYQHFGLGMAPLAGLEGDRLAPFMTKLGALIFEHGGRFYSFKGLRAFKQKFDPQWEPVYLAAPGQMTMPIALGNLALLSSGGILGLIQK